MIHHVILKFYLKQGIILAKVYKITTFNETHWLKKYFDFNTEQRSLTKTTFERILGS